MAKIVQFTGKLQLLYEVIHLNNFSAKGSWLSM